MREQICPIQKLVSLPAKVVDHFRNLGRRAGSDWFATSDPPGQLLGSGGATAHLLREAWKNNRAGDTFSKWLGNNRKLIIHGGGQSRRLPAYAPISKLLIPIPVFRWARGQRLDQTLLDLQLQEYERVLEHAPATYPLMITSGDVLLRFARWLPPFPKVDVLALGMWVNPEVAKDFGVFFSHRHQPQEIQFFLQKPSVAQIREHNKEFLPLVDSGMWLLSERAVRVLLELSGCQMRGQNMRGVPQPYDLYAHFGASLGLRARKPDPRITSLTTAVLPLPDAHFYPVSTSRQLIDTVSRIQSFELDESKIGLMGARQYPSQFLQNCRFEYPLSLDANHTLWVENSIVPKSWTLASGHVLTGIPENNWGLRLEPGICLDFVPVEQSNYCARVYHINDTFNGAIGHRETHWLGEPVLAWFAKRGLRLEDAGLVPDQDLQEAPLFPVLTRSAIDPRFLAWLFQREPVRDPRFAKMFLAAKRLSATDLLGAINLARHSAQQSENRRHSLAPMIRNGRFSIFYKLDLRATAELAVNSAARASMKGEFLPPPTKGLEPMQQVRDEMFRSAVARLRRQPGWESHTRRAFQIMRELIIQSIQLTGVRPSKSVFADQIIWGRSPARLDLAGGWTDTPPYCLEHGGKVVNVAVDLNGQPPIQVFARVCDEPELVFRSIDLGLEHRVRTFEELDTFSRLDSPFPFAKAAFALAGFLPAFLAPPRYRSLKHQLRDFGGGIELSMLAAVPKGSGLGTSSILGTTLLAVLSDLCGLGWNLETLFIRTLALEQMCTTGGGWQDQAGGMFRGIKLVETNPGILQRPLLQWLPEHVFGEDARNQAVLLYYTGVTRLAKNILDEIVRGIFLNARDTLRIIEDIGANAVVAANAIRSCNYQALVDSVRASWKLNQALDSGTNPPQIQAILDQVQDYLASAKLLGAGGGGYLLMFAKDPEAGNRIKKLLNDNPPNTGARFVDFTISQTGLQRTRS